MLSSTIFGISKDNKLDSSSTGSFIPSSTLPSLSYVTHDPIVITQDSEFDAAHGVSSGSGTELDPYIIEGWEITTATGNGIYVNGTSVYFIIRNCLIDGGGVSSELSYDSAILLNNTADGSALIENNTCLNSNFGILLSYSNFISSINNTITSCSVGIILQYANNSLLVNNTCTNNKWYGIFAGGSNNNSMIKNSCNLNVVSGLLLVYSDDNYLFENELYDNEYGIYIDRSNSSFIIDNLCVSNYYGIFYEDSFDNSLINSS
ncbi:MAG: right-handed parallel beta-helix repeat-containing protein, partial [Candidatus Heimdallarchaeota archaeon]|nr:right-handed parallel beta-helix repeat-containing protein [Candidatus Heimdallarchaeota archaeon]MCK5049247.1 right-handed parallel beta-helix repeat-containing protein [Candidatus Heimdallarchaeota archaeon]